MPEKDLTFDVDAAAGARDARTRLVFIANPNNPTGTYLSRDEMQRLHAGLPPSVLLVIDAAYAEFVKRNDYEPGIELVDRAENVVMTRTFSKIYALAALRLGWAYCTPAIADVLNRVRNPFNVNAPAQAAGVAALEDVAAVDPRARAQRSLAALARAPGRARAAVDAERRQFRAGALSADPRHNADAAFAFLQARGIIARQMAAYNLPEYLRITIGTEDEMAPWPRRWRNSGCRARARVMSDRPVRARGLHRHRPDRLVAGARDAARQARRARSSPAPAAPRRSTTVQRLDLADETHRRSGRGGRRAPISSCSRRRFRPMPRSASASRPR